MNQVHHTRTRKPQPSLRYQDLPLALGIIIRPRIQEDYRLILLIRMTRLHHLLERVPLTHRSACLSSNRKMSLVHGRVGQLHRPLKPLDLEGVV